MARHDPDLPDPDEALKLPTTPVDLPKWRALVLPLLLAGVATTYGVHRYAAWQDFRNGDLVRPELIVDGRAIALGTPLDTDEAIVRQALADPNRILNVRLSGGRPSHCDVRMRASRLKHLLQLSDDTPPDYVRHMNASEIAAFCNSGLTPDEAASPVQISFHRVSPQPSAYAEGKTLVRFDTLGKGNATEHDV